jgi:2-polyprenyl-3-methyl-5-hydroxy-6-metoxy-1,4-benzoquinol methylase
MRVIETSRKPQMSRCDPQTGHQTTAETFYTFENSGTQAVARFSALANIFDPGTIRHLTEIGVDSGWHCLEIGAGGGSIATWLCDRVGGSGRVLATDIDTRFLEELSRSKSVGTTLHPIRSRRRNSISCISAWFSAICQIETRFLAGS